MRTKEAITNDGPKGSIRGAVVWRRLRLRLAVGRCGGCPARRRAEVVKDVQGENQVDVKEIPRTKARPECRITEASDDRGDDNQKDATVAAQRRMVGTRIEDQKAGRPRDVDRPLRREADPTRTSERRSRAGRDRGLARRGAARAPPSTSMSFLRGRLC